MAMERGSAPIYLFILANGGEAFEQDVDLYCELMRLRGYFADT